MRRFYELNDLFEREPHENLDEVSLNVETTL